MNITYKVIDPNTGKDITNDEFWVIRPDGTLAYMEYCDCVGHYSAKAVFTVYDDAHVD